MIRIQLVIGTKKGETYQKALDDNKVKALVGLSIGDEFDGDLIGLKGYKLKIKGGSDEQGFPMRKALEGTGRQKRILKKGQGIRTKKKGLRKRKSVRGKVVSEEIAQLNTQVVEKGEKDIEKLLYGKEEEIEEEDGEKTEETEKESEE